MTDFLECLKCLNAQAKVDTISDSLAICIYVDHRMGKHFSWPLVVRVRIWIRQEQ